jgi:hypothetical protein
MPSITRSRKLKAIAQEYLIIVGAPSNMINGFIFDDPVTGDPVPSTPPPTSTDPNLIGNYINGVGPTFGKVYTHDQYWANFLFSGVFLIESKTVRPEPGDILTYAVYMPGYEQRNLLDWSASPYNPVHRNSVWVDAFPYNYRFRLADQDTPSKRSGRINQTRKAGPIVFATSQGAIDLEIFARRTGEGIFNGGYPKRPMHDDDYTRDVMVIPDRIVRKGTYAFPGRATPLRHVLTKVLIVRDPDDLLLYMSTGAWSGPFWTNPLTLPDPEEPRPPPPTIVGLDEAAWYANVNPTTDSHPDWALGPSVNRTRVKLKRLDYFGHSSAAEIFLQYGLSNKKGEVPEGEVVITKADIEALPVTIFTNDGLVKLWGCNLGEDMAQSFTSLAATVIACKARTTFEFVLENGGQLPQSDDPAVDFEIIP